jgi:1-acyl-sn-glycerol-3-phosphate acyltransferase
MDIPAIFQSILVPLLFLAKKELKKVPFLGWYGSFIGMIFIDRKNREKAYQSLRKAGEKIKKGSNVISFPEGTRSKDGRLQIFKRGTFFLASESDIGVVPIAVSGARDVMPAGSFKMRPGTITVRIGKPVYHRDFPEKSVEDFAHHVRGIVIEMLEN